MPKKKYTWKFTPEVVNGVCPTCEEDTLLVSITREYYRCVTCGTDLVQYVNGKIVYLPSITRTKDATPFVKEWKDG
jgi:ribosomal protein S27E